MKEKKISKLLSLFLVLFCARSAHANLPLFSETLTDAENRGLNTSNTLKASQETSQAAESFADSNKSSLFPRLTLDGVYFYETNVPTGTIAPGAPPVAFGTNSNYNIGPTLTYTLFDGGLTRGQWKSAQNSAKARQEDYRANEKQLRLNLRLAYFKLQYSLRNLEAVSDSLKLSQAQEHDIHNRFNAGASSRLDAVNAHRQVINDQLRFRQAQNDLASSVRDLFALTGENQNFDTSRPVPRDLLQNLPGGVDAPTMVVQTDPILSTLNNLSARKVSEPDQEHPQIKSLGYASEAARLASDAETSALWPRLTLSARAEYMYPNVVFPDTVQQNVFTASLSMPLFEFDMTRNLASQHLKESMSSEYQRQQKLTDFSRDWHKEKDLLDSLHSQEILTEENAKEAGEAARLTYQSYKAGKREYLDVESADVQLLEAQVNAAQVQTNILNTIAQLDYLSSQ